MPTVAAVTVTDNPTSLNSTPGVPVATRLTVTNAGNVAYDAAISPTLPSGWTISGTSTPVSLAIGASTTETATIIPPVDAALNSTQNVTLTYGPGVTQNAVSVLSVTPNPATVEADTQVDVSASVLAGVTQAEQGTCRIPSPTAGNGRLYIDAGGDRAAGSHRRDERRSGQPRHYGFQPRHVYDQCQRQRFHRAADRRRDRPGGAVRRRADHGEPIARTIGAPIATDRWIRAAAPSRTRFRSPPRDNWARSPPTAQGASVVVSGNYAYSIGASDITILNVSNPASPTVVGTFGSGTLNSDSTNLGALAGNDLVVASGNTNGTFNFLVYSLANPTSPVLWAIPRSTTSFPAACLCKGRRPT